EPPFPDDRLTDCRGLPLAFGRQPALRPAAPGVRLVPAYKHNGAIQLESLRAVVALPRPYAVCLWLPVNGTLGAPALTPRPAGFAQKFSKAITACLDELSKVPIGNRGARDPEWLELNLVRPLLVIENETFGFCSSKSPPPAGHFGITRQGTGGRRGALTQSGRRRKSQRLSHVGQRFDVHVLVTDRQFVEIVRMIRKIVSGEMLALPLQHVC